MINWLKNVFGSKPKTIGGNPATWTPKEVSDSVKKEADVVVEEAKEVATAVEKAAAPKKPRAKKPAAPKAPAKKPIKKKA